MDKEWPDRLYDGDEWPDEVSLEPETPLPRILTRDEAEKIAAAGRMMLRRPDGGLIWCDGESSRKFYEREMDAPYASKFMLLKPGDALVKGEDSYTVTAVRISVSFVKVTLVSESPSLLKLDDLEGCEIVEG